VDGKCAFLGGANIADEYINRRQRLGHWKDTGVRITGSGVRSVTVTFLQMWDMASRAEKTDYEQFVAPASGEGNCYMIPFAGGPLYRPLTPAHDIYETMCETAKLSVWYATPYLAPDSTLREAFCLAARGGIDIRIVTPAIPDHVTVFAATRGNYQRLLDAGVRIFEYTPGFMHAKMILCDNASAVVGSINIDTGSFYRQYENAVWFTGSPEVEKIAADFENVFEWCREIKRDEWPNRPLMQRFWEASMCLMSPLF
jgi:cardiolipin synthase